MMLSFGMLPAAPLSATASATSFYDPTGDVSDVPFWFTLKDASTVSSTSGKITQVDDKSGNGNNWKQINGVRQPTYDTSNSVAGSQPAMVWPTAGNNAVGLELDAAVNCDWLLFVIAYGAGTETGSFGHFRDIHGSTSMDDRTYGSSSTDNLTSAFAAVPSGVKINGTAPGANDYLPMPLCVMTLESNQTAGAASIRYLGNRSLFDRGWNGVICAGMGTTSVPSGAEQTALINGFSGDWIAS